MDEEQTRRLKLVKDRVHQAVETAFEKMDPGELRLDQERGVDHVERLDQHTADVEFNGTETVVCTDGHTSIEISVLGGAENRDRSEICLPCGDPQLGPATD